jgi:antitoxin CptB
MRRVRNLAEQPFRLDFASSRASFRNPSHPLPELPVTGLARSTDGLDPRRKRILFRAWHRGTREMDLLMGQYAEKAIDAMSNAELDLFEALIEVPDRDLFAWITGKEEVAANYDTPVFQALRAFHTHDKPIAF